MSRKKFKCDPDCGERSSCQKAPLPGHRLCGMCPSHGVPRHHCWCYSEEDS